MKFCWTTLQVNNLEITQKFYEEVVGLKLNRRFKPSEGMEIAFLGEGETEIELIESVHSEKYPTSGQISIGFVVETTLEDQISLLKKKGITALTEVVQPNPNIRFFYAKDPDGVSVQFVQRILD